MDSTKSLSVLIVEDEPDISDLYERALVKEGYTITKSTDGVDALNQAKKNIFDVILLDLMIPNLTGIEILKELKKPDSLVKAKVIIITNLEQKESDRQKLIDMADGYLVKASVTPHELAAYIKALNITI